MYRALKNKLRETVPPDEWEKWKGAKRDFFRYTLYLFLAGRILLPRNFGRFLKNRLGGRTLYFHPELPGEKHVMYKTCLVLGYRISGDAKRAHDGTVYWKTGTFRDAAANGAGPCLNQDCVDISKRKVEELVREVFGYGYAVDPLTYKGVCVKKSDANAMHDGVLVECPIKKKEEGFVYQRLINNQPQPGLTEDIRVSVIGREIPAVYVKLRPIGRRFKSDNLSVRLVEWEQVMTPAEKDKLLRLCERCGLDYGELDVLRDVDDKRLYVVDVNNCPFGPPPKTPKPHMALAVERFADALERLLSRN